MQCVFVASGHAAQAGAPLGGLTPCCCLMPRLERQVLCPAANLKQVASSKPTVSHRAAYDDAFPFGFLRVMRERQKAAERDKRQLRSCLGIYWTRCTIAAR